jgi:hypothetical protein
MTRWIGLGAAATLALALAGCGSSSSGGGAAAGDASTDVGTPPDGSRHDGGDGGHEGGGHDGSTEAGPDGGTDAGMCQPPVSKQGPACDACITSNCETTWCACRGDTDNVNDAGVSGCLLYVECVQQCVANDAGTPTDCFGTICATASYTTNEQHEGHALVDCRVQYCSTECGQ